MRNRTAVKLEKRQCRSQMVEHIEAGARLDERKSGKYRPAAGEDLDKKVDLLAPAGRADDEVEDEHVADEERDDLDRVSADRIEAIDVRDEREQDREDEEKDGAV